ncbi:MAG: hypothetical protein NZ528_10565 [Caldilineales bacterium]|nr:hypothetical protein [Caldilineales bacterium]MDW8319097.1 hypothetical protein [Anaerolineae bacterium]
MRFLFLLFILPLLAACRPADPPPPRVGVHTLPADRHTLALAAEGGFDAVVELFSWRQIEPTRDQWHWQLPDEVVAGAAYYGLDLVVRLDQHPAWASDVPLTLNAPPDDLADYVRFVGRVAERYRGRVLGYVIWNEPNLAIDWGGRPPDPKAYTDMLCRAYTAVKAADPDALVAAAGLAPTDHNDAEAMDERLFLRAMLEAGAGQCFDVLAAHPYGFGQPPDAPRSANNGLVMARVEDLRALLVEHGLRDRPIWATELGWTVDRQGSQGWQAVSEEQQAAYLAQTLEVAAQRWPWMTLLAVWNLPSVDGPGGERPPERLPADFLGYSLVDPEGRPRPAYYRLQALNRSRPRGDRPQPRPTLSADAAVRVPVLAADAVVHLGDSDFSRPWAPLYAARNPSVVWRGVAYVPDEALADGRPWRLSLLAMQSNVWDNYLWINGRRLEPPLPVEDFGGQWVRVTWEVPAAWLQGGPNELALTIGRTHPLLADLRFAWDDLQIKDAVLWSVNGER